MPRKVNYGLDYEDDYDMYDDDFDYEYDYDANVGGDEKPSSVEKAASKPGIWRCSICTYDNDEPLSFCDICGAIRDPSTKIYNNGLEKDVPCKSYGVSAMAKSLFTPMPSGTHKAATLFQQLTDESPGKDASNSYQNRNIQARFSEPNRTFMDPQHNHRISIAPFTFESPSPYDFVSLGKNVSKGNPKVLPVPTRASTSVTEKKEVVKVPTAETSKTYSPPLSKANNFMANNSSDAESSGDKCEIVTSNLQEWNLNKVSGDQRNSANSKKTNLPSQYKPEKWMSDQEKGTLKQLNLAIVGHVDSGKSTLSGRLLHLLGRVSQKDMHKFEKGAKEMGKASFAYAWAMDESAEERERGVTMTVAVAYFDTQNYQVVLLDSPGHKDFVPNMISGATQADAAIIVVDASKGSFEAGMDGYGVGQTREHAQLIRSFGVEHVIVLVNKMDAVGYSKERFDFIKSQLGSFLRSCQFKESFVAWIPASAMENQNLARTSSDARLSSWYNGPCLLEAIDSLQPPERDLSKPLRLPICDVIRSNSSGQVSLSGKLETGAIRNGSKVLVMPSGDLATVRSIERDSRTCTIARAGDNVAVALQGIDVSHVITGGVICHPDFPVAVGTCLELKIYVLDITMPILAGSLVEFHTHHAKEAAKISKILSVVDQKTKKAKNAPRFLTAKQSAVIEVVLERAVCVEEFSNYRALGRAFLRASGNTIAVGTVARIIYQE